MRLFPHVQLSKILPSCEPLCTSAANGWHTSCIVDIPAIKLSTGARWMSIIALACGRVCFYCGSVLAAYCLCGSQSAKGRAATLMYSSSAMTFTHLQSCTGCNRWPILRYYHCQEVVMHFMVPDLQGGNTVGVTYRKTDVTLYIFRDSNSKRCSLFSIHRR